MIFSFKGEWVRKLCLFVWDNLQLVYFVEHNEGRIRKTYGFGGTKKNLTN